MAKQSQAPDQGPQPRTGVLPQSNSVKKVHKDSGLEHEFPKTTWDLLGAAKQKEFEDATDKPEVEQ
jgi:hypothetical protein